MHVRGPSTRQLALIAALLSVGMGCNTSTGDTVGDDETGSGPCSPGTLACECLENLCISNLSCIDNICTQEPCTPGTIGCECVEGECLGGTPCVEGVCVDPSGDGDGDSGDGDGDSGDGDGDTGDGDGDTGDGDGDTGDGDGDTGDGDGDTGDGDGDQPEPVPCGQAEMILTVPQIMFVLDKSGSMKVFWDHDGNPNTPGVTRWSSLHNILSSVIATFDHRFDFGAMLFPSNAATSEYNANACLVAPSPEIPISPNGQAVIAGIPASNDLTIFGGTPTENAVETAGEYLVSLDNDLPKAMILITDGLANCSDNALNNNQLFEIYDLKLPQTVASFWQQTQIPIHVVGIDIDQMLTSGATDGVPNNVIPWCKLDEIGELGGAPALLAEQFSCAECATDEQDFYSAVNEAQLLGALENILNESLACRATLDPVPEFPALLQVEISGSPVPKVANCGLQDGWVYTHPNGPYDSIEFCGSWCDQLNVATAADAHYFCEP